MAQISRRCDFSRIVKFNGNSYEVTASLISRSFERHMIIWFGIFLKMANIPTLSGRRQLLT